MSKTTNKVIQMPTPSNETIEQLEKDITEAEQKRDNKIAKMRESFVNEVELTSKYMLSCEGIRMVLSLDIMKSLDYEQARSIARDVYHDTLVAIDRAKELETIDEYKDFSDEFFNDEFLLEDASYPRFIYEMACIDIICRRLGGMATDIANQWTQLNAEVKQLQDKLFEASFPDKKE